MWDTICNNKIKTGSNTKYNTSREHIFYFLGIDDQYPKSKKCALVRWWVVGELGACWLWFYASLYCLGMSHGGLEQCLLLSFRNNNLVISAYSAKSHLYRTVYDGSLVDPLFSRSILLQSLSRDRQRLCCWLRTELSCDFSDDINITLEALNYFLSSWETKGFFNLKSW